MNTYDTYDITVRKTSFLMSEFSKFLSILFLIISTDNFVRQKCYRQPVQVLYKFESEAYFYALDKDSITFFDVLKQSVGWKK